MKMTKDKDKHCMISMEVGYNEEDHNHQSNNENENEDIVYGLPDNVKKIAELEKLGVKPRAIMENLRQEGLNYKV